MVAVLQPVKQGRIIPIDRAVILVGRSADCDAVINGSQKISRRHCCLVQVDDGYFVRDLGSMNGVWLNGEKVKREAPISTGDRLAVGDVEFLFYPNARIEQKNTITAAPELLPTDTNDPPPIPLPDSSSIDDVIPLDDVDIIDDEDDDETYDLLIDTNEVEIVDAPIIDDIVDAPVINIDEDDDLDEVIVFED